MRWPASLRLIPLAAGVLACGGPGAAPGEEGRASTRDSAGIAVSYAPASTVAPTCASKETLRIGALDGDAGQQFGWLGDAVRLSDAALATLDRMAHEVRIYSDGGRLLSAFGREGEGPGELRSVWSLHALPGDTLVVENYRPWRFTRFTRGGDVVGTVQLEPVVYERPYFALPLPRGGYLVGLDDEVHGGTIADRSVVVARYGENGVLTDTVGRFWVERAGRLDPDLPLVAGPIFGARAGFDLFGDDAFVYASGRVRELEIRGLDGALRRVIRWGGGPRDVEPQQVEQWKRDWRTQVTRRGDPGPRGRAFLDAQLSDDRPVAAAFPAHDGVLVGRDGRIRVKEYRRPLADGPDHWLVFEPDGRLRCRVEVPPGLQLVDAGEDYLLGVVRDEFDVQYLVLRRVAP